MSDLHRPIYHFTPPSGWMNDPNGLIRWRGRYHMFYQHNPVAAIWGPMHWGHAVSDDLMHWEHLPIAMAPTPGSADEDGCWSGCAVVNAGVPTFVYTGVRKGAQRPCLATALDDDLLTWQKHPGNPVIAGPPAGLDVAGFRDHCVWFQDGAWRMVIGSGIKGGSGMALLYRSLDLVTWDYLGPLVVGKGEETGEMWECPDFFPLGDRHVLMISALPQRRVMALIGTYDGLRFHVESHQLFDDGHFYAPQTLADGPRRLMWGWLDEGRTPEAHLAAGWAGAMSLPRELFLHADGSLGIRPVPEAAALRGRRHHLDEVVLASDAGDFFLPVTGRALEIVATFEPGDARACGLAVCCSPDGAERTEIVYDVTRRRLLLDRTRASLDPAAHRDERGSTCDLAAGGLLSLRIFLDGSVLEILANERVSLTGRIYPTRADSDRLALFARGGTARLRSLEAWEMQPLRR